MIRITTPLVVSLAGLTDVTRTRSRVTSPDKVVTHSHEPASREVELALQGSTGSFQNRLAKEYALKPERRVPT